MSKFNDAMNLSTPVALDEMAETVWKDGVPLEAIIDPLDLTTGRTPGGVGTDAEAEVYIKRDIYLHHRITKGTIFAFSHAGEQYKLRVTHIEDDGSDLLMMTCGAVLKSTVPGL